MQTPAAPPEGDVALVVDAGGDGPEASTPVPTYLIFITSEAYMGDLGGKQGATDRCNGLAAGKFGDRKFVALLPAGNDLGAAFAGLAEGRYVRTDGVELFSKKPSQVSVPKAYLRDENGAETAGYVWTGFVGADCDGWTTLASDKSGAVGTHSPSFTRDVWLRGDTANCSTGLHLYCVELP